MEEEEGILKFVSLPPPPHNEKKYIYIERILSGVYSCAVYREFTGASFYYA